MEGLMEKLAPYSGIIWMIVIFAIFYFILIRPQQQQQKRRREMLASLKKGDRVLPIGGIYGVIKEINDDVLTLRIADNVNIKFARGGIERVIDDEED